MSTKKMGFGKWADLTYGQCPVDYLLWMVSANHTYADEARAELARRGTTIPTLSLSGHAIDRASQRLLHLWAATRKPARTDGNPYAEGLHSWLVRMATEARELGTPGKNAGVFHYQGIVFAFESDDKTAWPVLKTVIEDRDTLPYQYPEQAERLLSIKDDRYFTE